MKYTRNEYVSLTSNAIAVVTGNISQSGCGPRDFDRRKNAGCGGRSDCDYLIRVEQVFDNMLV